MGKGEGIVDGGRVLTKLLAYASLLRLEHSLLVFLVVLIYTGRPEYALPPALACAFAFADNDLMDVETDRINRRDRPLALGLLREEEAGGLSLLLLSLSLLTSLVHPLVFWVVLPLVLLSLLYNRILKDFPLLGNLFIAITMATPFAYSALFSSKEGLWTLALLALIFGTGREILKDCDDFVGDVKARGSKTLPALLGKEMALWLGRGLVFLSGLIGLFFLRGQLVLPGVLLAFLSLLFRGKAFRALSLLGAGLLSFSLLWG